MNTPLSATPTATLGVARSQRRTDAAERPAPWSLTEAGAACVNRWVLANAQNPAQHALSAWYRYAEAAARRAAKTGEPVVLELTMSQTKSGYPEELVCAPAWFVQP